MKRRLSPLVVLAAPLLLAGVLSAQEAPAVQASANAGRQPATGPIHLTLQQAIDRAVKANPALMALRHQKLSTVKNAKAVARSRWGDINAVASYSRYNDDWMVRPMSEELFLKNGFAGLPWDRNQVHYGVTLQVPLYLGGTLKHTIRIARFSSEQTATLFTGTRWQTRFNAVSLYTAAQSLDTVADALDELIATLQKTKERLDLMVQEGKRPEVDRLKVLEQYQDAIAQRETINADRIKVGSLLLALLGENPERTVQVDPLPASMPTLHATPEDLARTLDSVSTVRRARLELDKARSSKKIARAAFLPRIVASGNYMQNTAPSVDNALDTWQFSVGLSIPLFAGGSRFERLGAAKESQQAARFALQNSKLQVAARLREALARFQAAKAELEAGKARVAAGNEAARIENIRYEAGAGTIEDLLRADARREEAKAFLARSRAGVLTAGEGINSIVEKETVK